MVSRVNALFGSVQNANTKSTAGKIRLDHTRLGIVKADLNNLVEYDRNENSRIAASKKEK